MSVWKDFTFGKQQFALHKANSLHTKKIIYTYLDTIL